jgi:choline-sulfatase
MLPVHHGIHDNHGAKLDPNQMTLALALKQAGYTTQAFVSSLILDHHFGLDNGFDRYDDFVQASSEESEAMEGERIAGDTTSAAIDWLQQNKKSPFFLFVHYYDPHARYEPPEPYRSRYVKNEYFGEIAYVDEQVGKLMKAIEPVRANTLVILTSDHGEGMGNHDELSHGLFIYDSTIHVPLLISGPGLAAAKQIETQTRAIDVMPTLLAFTGITLPSGVDGRSLLPLIRGENWQESDTISESLYAMVLGWHPLFSVRNSRWKYVDAPKPELYDLAKDPGETTNVVQSNQCSNSLHALRLNPLC